MVPANHTQRPLQNPFLCQEPSRHRHFRFKQLWKGYKDFMTSSAAIGQMLALRRSQLSGYADPCDAGSF
jgi:hypothetical protein